MKEYLKRKKTAQNAQNPNILIYIQMKIRKGLSKGLGFKDAETARKSVNIIEKSSKPHKHKVQATMAMEQRSRFAAKNAKDPEKKKNYYKPTKFIKPI